MYMHRWASRIPLKKNAHARAYTSVDRQYVIFFGYKWVSKGLRKRKIKGVEHLTVPPFSNEPIFGSSIVNVINK